MNSRSAWLAAVLCLAWGHGGLAAQTTEKEPVHNGKTLSEWIKELQTTDVDARVTALQAIAAIGPKAESAVPSLLPMLADEELPIRYEASSALGRIGKGAPAPNRFANFGKGPE